MFIYYVGYRGLRLVHSQWGPQWTHDVVCIESKEAVMRPERMQEVLDSIRVAHQFQKMEIVSVSVLNVGNLLDR